ncbi:MAG: hypothetical protein HKN02_15165 [Rhodobacteraceae bacterium]|nr:hypothetical protein [Paracoccaceae bacterium]
MSYRIRRPPKDDFPWQSHSINSAEHSAQIRKSHVMKKVILALLTASTLSACVSGPSQPGATQGAGFSMEAAAPIIGGVMMMAAANKIAKSNNASAAPVAQPKPPTVKPRPIVTPKPTPIRPGPMKPGPKPIIKPLPQPLPIVKPLPIPAPGLPKPGLPMPLPLPIKLPGLFGG